MSDWRECRVVRDKDGDLWMRDAAHGLWCAPGEYFEPEVAELERNYGPLTPVLDADGLPVVTPAELAAAWDEGYEEASDLCHDNEYGMPRQPNPNPYRTEGDHR